MIVEGVVKEVEEDGLDGEGEMLMLDAASSDGAP